MNPLRSKLVISCALLSLTLAGQAFADSTGVSMNDATATPSTHTVRQEIVAFANHYGNSIIVHDGINLDAPVTVAFDQGLSSDQAITLLSQAAGGAAERVYFVTPAIGGTVTTGDSAARLMGARGQVTLDWHGVSSRAAIEAIAQSVNAQVRFPDGAPDGVVNFDASGMPVSDAIARVAAITKTNWKLGYLLEPTSEAQNALTMTQSESVVASLPPLKPLPRDAAGNILPFTIHISNTPPVQTASAGASQSSLTPQQAAAEASREAQLAEQQYYDSTGINGANIPASVYDPTVQTFPGDSLFGGPDSANQTYLGSSYGTVQTVIPDGNQSGFKLLQDNGNNGY